MVKYLNWKGETIDSLSLIDFPNRMEFRKERVRLLREYEMAGMVGCYWSQRACKGWNK